MVELWLPESRHHSLDYPKFHWSSASESATKSELPEIALVPDRVPAGNHRWWEKLQDSALLGATDDKAQSNHTAQWLVGAIDVSTIKGDGQLGVQKSKPVVRNLINGSVMTN